MASIRALRGLRQTLRAFPAAPSMRRSMATASRPVSATGILFPVWSGRCGFAVNEVARRHGDFAMAGAVVAVELDTNDRVRRCAIAMFGMGPAARRAHAAESELVGSQLDSIDLEEIGRCAVRELDAVVGDAHVPEEYRRRIGAVVVERALREAVQEARDG